MTEFSDEPEAEYDGETIIPIVGGGSIRCPSAEVSPPGVDYVRVCDADGKEVAYWSVDEWIVDVAQGMEVMGAILGAARGTIAVEGPVPEGLDERGRDSDGNQREYW